MKALRDALANHSDAEIHVIYVVDPPDPTFPPWEEPSLGEGARDRWENLTAELFDDARDVAEEHGVELTTAMLVGKPARKIVEYAEEHGVARIVMGSHGRSGVSRILLGSVAEGVIRQSPVSVTVVRED